MKAWVLHNINDFHLENVPIPVLKEQEVLVEVKAVGICGSDIPRIYHTGAHIHPLILGHEFSGKVVEVGKGVNKVWIGQRVGIFPLIPCRICSPCRQKKYEMCRNYSYLGSRRDGGFAEYASVPVWNLIRLSEQVTYEEAAMLEPMAVVVHAMRKGIIEACTTGNPWRSDKIVICGIGTIGMLLFMFLKEIGFEHIYLIGNKDFQKKMVIKMGAKETYYCDIRRQEPYQWLMEQTDGMGANIFFECVGKSETYGLAIKSMAWGGKVVLVGNPYSDMALEKELYWKILRNQLTVAGTWNSSYLHETEDDWNYVLKKATEKKIFPAEIISHRFSLEELVKGVEIMRDKKEDYGKVMGSWEKKTIKI